MIIATITKASITPRMIIKRILEFFFLTWGHDKYSRDYPEHLWAQQSPESDELIVVGRSPKSPTLTSTGLSQVVAKIQVSLIVLVVLKLLSKVPRFTTVIFWAKLLELLTCTCR